MTVDDGVAHRRGLIDTNIVILRDWLAPSDLPQEVAISAVTLAELSAGPHAVTGDSDAAIHERARRIAILQRTESEFDPLPFDATAARAYGQLIGATVAAGRSPRRRVADLQIAATAVAHALPLYTTNPADYVGLDRWLNVVAVTRPATNA
ncbi:MAG: type II toxin-antitoxin system VapC family toxin [Patulibacter sp.]